MKLEAGDGEGVGGYIIWMFLGVNVLKVSQSITSPELLLSRKI